MKQKITIHKEILAKKCEICHKEDEFDIEKQVCNRCCQYDNLAIENHIPDNKNKVDKQLYFKKLNENYEKNIKVGEQEKENKRKLVIYTVASFMISITTLVLISQHLLIGYWVLLSILGLSSSLYFFWYYKNDIALSIFKGILFSYVFLALSILVFSNFIFFWLLLAFALLFGLKIFVSAVNE